eukprot:scaffold17414_cov53-Phaeocystis_antarctica.AAC.3
MWSPGEVGRRRLAGSTQPAATAGLRPPMSTSTMGGRRSGAGGPLGSAGGSRGPRCARACAALWGRAPLARSSWPCCHEAFWRARRVLEGQGQQLHLRGGAQLKLQAGGRIPRRKGRDVAEHLAGREAAQHEGARAVLPALGRVTVVPALVALTALEDAALHGAGAGHRGELRAARDEKGEHSLQRRADEGLRRRGRAAALQVEEAAGGHGVVLDEVSERGELRGDEAAERGHLPQLRHNVRRLRRAMGARSATTPGPSHHHHYTGQGLSHHHQAAPPAAPRRTTTGAARHLALRHG